MTRSKKVLTDTGLNKLVTNINNTFAPLNSPALTGAPTAPTPTSGDDSTKIATTAFVQDALDDIEAITDEQITSAWGDIDPETGIITPVAPSGSDITYNSMTASDAETGTSVESMLISPKVLADYVANHAISSVDWNSIVNKPNLFTPETHNQASNTINVLTGYTKASIADALSANDTLNIALGKLEKLIDERAALDSPAFVGTPTAPTQSAGDNSTKIATTAYADTAAANAISDLVNQAPATLDTLEELATALGDDPNFATTVATQIGTKAPLSSPALTGTPTAPTATAGTNNTQIATTAFVNTAIGNAVGNAANKIPVYSADGHLVLPNGIEIY